MHIPNHLKAKLLQKLYYYAMIAPAARTYGTVGPNTLPLKEAEEHCHGYIDYLGGRCIKVDFRKNDLDFRLYNRDSSRRGEELALEVLAEDCQHN